MRKEDCAVRDINMTMDNGKPEILMTGQEWYDRFQDEVNRINDLTVLDKEMKEQTAIGLSPAQAAISLAITKMNNAAKAAAGLE